MTAGDTPDPAARPVVIRDAAEADLPAIQALYAHHVLNGLATFEEAPPSVTNATPDQILAKIH